MSRLNQSRCLTLLETRQREGTLSASATWPELAVLGCRQGPGPISRTGTLGSKVNLFLAQCLAVREAAASTKANAANLDFSEIITNPQKRHVDPKTSQRVGLGLAQHLAALDFFQAAALAVALRLCNGILTAVHLGASLRGAGSFCVTYHSCIFKIVPTL